MRRKQNRKKYTTPFYLLDTDGNDYLFYGKVRNRHIQRTDMGNTQFSSKSKFIETDFDYVFTMNDSITDAENNRLRVENIDYREEQAAKSRRSNIIWEIDIS